MKKLILASVVALSATAHAQEQRDLSLRDINTYFIQQCLEVGKNTKEDCSNILYQHGYSAGRKSRDNCSTPYKDYKNQRECLVGEVHQYIKDNWEQILEDVTTPIGTNV